MTGMVSIRQSRFRYGCYATYSTNGSGYPTSGWLSRAAGFAARIETKSGMSPPQGLPPPFGSAQGKPVKGAG